MLTIQKKWTVKRSDGSGLRCRCLAVCDCGDVSEYDPYNIKRGNSTRCKKCAVKSRAEHRRKHGLAGKNKHEGGKLYYTWHGMKRRCHNPSDSRYEMYGGRGIKVCDLWRDSFENFAKDMGEPPTLEHSIERIDNNGNYEPSNCKWVTILEQASNKRNNRHITVGDKTMTLQQWSRETGIKRETIAARMNCGWTPEDAVSMPENEGHYRYMIEGKRHKTLRSIEDEYNMSTSGVHGRIESKSYQDWVKIPMSGEWDEEAYALKLGAPKPATQKSRIIDCFGKAQSMAEWSRETGIDYAVLQARLDRGMSAEKALTAPVGSIQPSYVYTIKGDEYSTISQAAKATGLSKNACHNRFNSPRFPEWKKEEIKPNALML